MQMTNNGAGIYYKPGLTKNDNSQFIADIGLHFDNSTKIVTYYSYSNSNRSVSMEISGVINGEYIKIILLEHLIPSL